MNSLRRMRRSARPVGAMAAPTSTSTTRDETAPSTADELPIPSHYRCPISLELMKDPVITPTGITYDRPSIESWLDAGHDSCPVTMLRIRGGAADLIPNHTIRISIQKWCVENRELGIERIPTPRIPLTRTQAAEMAKAIEEAAWRGDAEKCAEVVRKVRDHAKESDRNRRCIASGAAVAKALAGAFEAFAAKQTASVGATCVLEEILSSLVLTFLSSADLHEPSTVSNYYSTTLASLASPSSLRTLVSIMTHGDFAARHNAVLAVKELVYLRSSSPSPSQHATAVSQTDGLVAALVSLIRDPISPRTTKTSLITAYHMLTPDSNNSINAPSSAAERFVSLGAVPPLLETLADSDRSMCEKALCLLDRLCDCPAGRDAAYAHALTVPVLVKKIIRVSDVTTRFAVSTLWKLCTDPKHKAGCATDCLHEAMQVGAFQKLLLVLQMGCAPPTKDKVSDLLKRMNACRGTTDCIDSVDFKGLKRPF